MLDVSANGVLTVFCDTHRTLSCVLNQEHCLAHTAPRLLQLCLCHSLGLQVTTGDVNLCFLGLQLNDAPLAIVDKRRSSHNVSEVMNLIGDVKDKVAVLVDDMIDTAGTITNAAKVSS